jgi:peptidoglycan-associated lipoprotein
MIRTTRGVTFLFALALTATACGRRQEEAAPPPAPAVNQDSIDAERARQDSIARAEQARRDSLAAAERARAERDRMLAEARNTLTAAIYFEFDSDQLAAEATAGLDAKLAILNANPGLRLRISGHADERGSDEYNLALGQRRAAAAKRYLTGRGIADDRIEIISFGEERPAAQGSDESAWAQNRRDEFEITAGGDQLRAPGQ